MNIREPLSKKLRERLPSSEVEWAMDLSCGRISDPERAISYFCGVCWKKIREREG